MLKPRFALVGAMLLALVLTVDAPSASGRTVAYVTDSSPEINFNGAVFKLRSDGSVGVLSASRRLGNPQGMVAFRGDLLVAANVQAGFFKETGGLFRIDRKTGKARRFLKSAPFKDVGDVARRGHFLWVGESHKGAVYRVDLRHTKSIVKVRDPKHLLSGHTTASVEPVGRSIYVTAFGDSVYRLDARARRPKIELFRHSVRRLYGAAGMASDASHTHLLVAAFRTSPESIARISLRSGRIEPIAEGYGFTAVTRRPNGGYFASNGGGVARISSTGDAISSAWRDDRFGVPGEVVVASDAD